MLFPRKAYPSARSMKRHEDSKVTLTWCLELSRGIALRLVGLPPAVGDARVLHHGSAASCVGSG